MNNAIIYLIGYPGIGKYTIARAIADRTDARVLDNHLVNNPIFAVLPRGSLSALPPEVWSRVGQIRELMLQSVEDLAPSEYSFILTNVINGDDPKDVAVYERVRAVARARTARFVPVVLHCDPEEQARRVITAERHSRFKWTDVDAVTDLTARLRLHVPGHRNLLRLDVTSRTPRESASEVVAHVATCVPEE
ncbi:MAG: hypothetical protein ACKVT1_17700 [Dehalococcoidia bacterium]